MPTRAPEYIIQTVGIQPEMVGKWNGAAWSNVAAHEIGYFRPESSPHKPVTRFKLQYDSRGLYGIFKVKDRFVRCIHTDYQSDVFKDSCVEIFLEPKAGRGYFNFEFNCGGTLLAYHILDSKRTNGKFKDYVVLSEEADSLIKRFHSTPATVDPEVLEPLDWYLEFFIPFSVMENFVGPINTEEGWRGNLYKCGDDTSQPHWGAWSPVDELDFHRPINFGRLHFTS